MKLSTRQFGPDDSTAWDQLCGESSQATFLHTRKFLSYHGDRFQDASLMIELDGRLVGIFPAAVSEADPSLIVSHPGISFGGLLHYGKLGGGAYDYRAH